MRDVEERQATSTDDPPPPDRHPTLSEVIGRRLRDAREAAGLRQADLAEAANKFGLGWGRSSVAALERGSRKLSVDELVILRRVLAVAGMSTDLLEDHDIVQVSDTCAIWGQEARRSLLSGREFLDLRRARDQRKKNWGKDEWAADEWIETAGADWVSDFDVDGSPYFNPFRGFPEDLEPGDRLFRAKQGLASMRIYLLAHYVWPNVGKAGASKVLSAPLSELDRKVSSKIGARPQITALIAQALWGKTLTEERDERTASRGDYETKRALQSARGYVTRELVKEIDDEWQKNKDVVASLLEEAEELEAKPELAELWLRARWKELGELVAHPKEECGQQDEDLRRVGRKLANGPEGPPV